MADRLAVAAFLGLLLSLALFAQGLQAQRDAQPTTTVVIPTSREGALAGSGEPEIRYVDQVSLPSALSGRAGRGFRAAGLGLLAAALALAGRVPSLRSPRMRTRLGALLIVPGAYAWWSLFHAANAGPGLGDQALATLQSAGLIAVVSAALAVSWGRGS